MRGRTSLFDSLFPNVNADDRKARKGRSEQLINKRNELLLCRYVFYASANPRLQYEFIVERLSSEFFLSSVTIPEIIAVHRTTIDKLRKAPVKGLILDCADKYPFFVWNMKHLLRFN